MLYYIIGIIAALAVLTVFFIPKRQPSKRELKKLSDEDFFSGIRNIARENRVIERGRGVSIQPLLRYLARAERVVSAKVRRNKPVTEGEKWYFENLYYVKRFIDGFNMREFSLLPRSIGGVRVLVIARYIVENSAGLLNFERIKKAIDIVNNESILNYHEIRALRSAIGLAVLEQIYMLSRRIIHYNKMERLSQRGYFEPLLKSDIYLYYFLKHNSHPDIKEKLARKGVNVESIGFNHSMSVVDTTRMAKYLFDTLKNLQDILGDEDALGLSVVDRELSARGAYKDMSFNTKKLYLSRIADISDRINAGELLVAKKLVNLAKFNNIDPITVLLEHTAKLIKYVRSGYYLVKLKEKNSIIKEYLYIGAMFLLTVGLSAAVYFIFRSFAAAIAALPPLFIIAEAIINNILSETVKPRPLPEMNYLNIPSEHNTIITIAEFIGSEEQMKEALKHLEIIRESNADANITAALLIDLKPADTEETVEDGAIIDAAREYEGREGYCIYIRKRKNIDGRYKAYERKRGAINELVKYLITGEKDEFCYISNHCVGSPSYMLTLDADNILSVGGAKELINIIAHPANARYDLITARSRYNLFSLITPFAKRFRRESAFINYPNYSSLYYNVFTRDIFCGKGIFRIKSFYNKLDGVFPDNKILSHDIIEGAILETASGSVLYEDAPKNFVADRERIKRWARGDIQLLPFIGRGWKKKDGTRHISKIRPIYKFLIIRNFINILFPIFTLAVGVISLFYPYVWTVFALLLLAPVILDVIGMLRRAVKEKIRPRYTAKDIALSISNAVIEAGLLPYYALCNARLVITTFWRMISGGSLLEWKTFYQSQSMSGKFINETAPSMIIAPLIALALLIGGAPYIPVLIFAAASYAIYYLVYKSGEEQEEKLEYTDIMRSYLKKTYLYFRYMRKSGSLIADNLQIKPYKGMSETTSPTNIGFQIIAEICAVILGETNRSDAILTLKDIVSAIENLEKWHGNLYNWYYIAKKTPAVPFVSSIDSGNFVASLIMLKGFLDNKEDKLLRSRVEKLIKSTDLSALYDPSKRQFYLGYNTVSKRFDGHYDLLASESRLLSLVYISLYGDAAHWKALIRDFTPDCGNTLLSWSGTMFEYIMPELFLQSPKGSLCRASAHNAVSLQIKARSRGLFGRSESGYYAFDDGLRYQYKAFGIDALSLGRDKEKNIISPYSSFLALEYNPKAVADNLEKIAATGGLSDYGFYEALDMEGRTRVLYSYMTHHQGMIMASLTNYLTGGKLRKLMQKDPGIGGVQILLTEEQEKHTFRKKIEERERKSLKNKLEYYKYIANVEYSTAATGLSDGITGLYCDALGGGCTMWNGVIINRFIKGAEERSGRHYYIRNEDGKVSSPTYITLKDNPSKYAFSYTPVSATYHNNEDNVKLDLSFDSNLFAIIEKLTIDEPNGKRLFFYEPLALSSYDAQNAHPTFNNLFVTTEYLDEHKAIIAKRRLRKGERPVFVALVMRGLTDIKPESNRYNALGRGRTERRPRLMTTENPVYPQFGDVLEPCFAFSASLTGASAEIIKIMSDDYEDLLQKIQRIPDDYYGFATEAGSDSHLQELTNKLLYPLMSLPYNNKFLADVDKRGARDEFFNYTSGKKLLVYFMDDASELSYVKTFAITLAELRYFGLNPASAVLLPKGADAALRQEVAEILKNAHISDCRICENSGAEGLISAAFILLNKNFNVPERTFYFSQVHDEENEVAAIPEGEYLIKSGAGGITQDGYLLPLAKYPPLPYSNVIGREKGGFFTTENGGGAQYFHNSYENRMLRFDNDPIKDTPYEQIHLTLGDKTVRLNGGRNGTSKVLISAGKTVFFSELDGIKAETEMYSIDEGAVKIIEINLKGEAELKLLYSFEALLGSSFAPPFIYSEKADSHTVKIKNFLTYREAFIRIYGESISDIDIAALNANVRIGANVNLKGGAKIYVAVGQYKQVINLESGEISEKKRLSLKYFNSLNNVNIKTADVALDELFNKWLMYQTVSSRLNARCGYYQLGGATGYRDQLQDVLALLQSNPARTREQILLHAERQYEEGDVMHWWHEPRAGLRTKISDDKLFLPYLTAEYIEVTSDSAILNEQIAYLTSPILGKKEHARYECAALTDYKESLLEHCVRAIKSA
ncbi:MAG: glucoamylase family protein, partial [Clostridia bacterium]